MVQAVTPEPPDSGGEVGGRHEPNSIPVSSDDEWNAMMVDAECQSEKDTCEFIHKKIEDAIAVVEAAASNSFVHVTPSSATTSALWTETGD